MTYWNTAIIKKQNHMHAISTQKLLIITVYKTNYSCTHSHVVHGIIATRSQNCMNVHVHVHVSTQPEIGRQTQIVVPLLYKPH